MRKSGLSRYKQTKLIEFFVAGVTARVAGELVGGEQKHLGFVLSPLRQIIFEKACNLDEFDGEVEIDESYFGGRRKGRRGRGAPGKIPVFGLLKRGSKVYALPVADVK